MLFWSILIVQQYFPVLFHMNHFKHIVCCICFTVKYGILYKICMNYDLYFVVLDNYSLIYLLHLIFYTSLQFE